MKFIFFYVSKNLIFKEKLFFDFFDLKWVISLIFKKKIIFSYVSKNLI